MPAKKKPAKKAAKKKPAKKLPEAVEVALEKKAAKKPKKPSRGERGDILQRSVEKLLKDAFGGSDGLFLVVNKKGEEVRTITWLEQTKKYEDFAFQAGRDSLVKACYFDGYKPTIAKKHPGWPMVFDMATELRQIEMLLLAGYGRHETDLDVFDRLETGDDEVITRFLFGERKVCSIVKEGRGYRLRTGEENRKDYYLRADICGDVADDEEYAAMLPELLAKLKKYCVYYEDEADGWLGNWFLHYLMLALASPWVPVDMRPLLVCIGDSENGKSSLLRLIAWMLGGDATAFLDGATFTKGSEEIKGPRLLEERGKLRFPRIGIALDMDDDAVWDNGFIKNFCAAGEVNSIGGMYEKCLTVLLECLGIVATNKMPRDKDASGGSTRRKWVLKFREKMLKAGEEEKSNIELRAEYKPYAATFRRLLLESIRRLVEVHKCKLPKLPPVLREDKQAVVETSQWDMKVALENCFRRAGEDEAAFHGSTADKFKMCLGSRVTAANTDTHTCRQVPYLPYGDSPEEEKKREKAKAKLPHYRGVFLIAQILAQMTNNKSPKQSTISNLMETMGFYKDSRGKYAGYTHTDYLVVKLKEFYDGNAAEVLSVLECLYENSDGSRVPLTPEQRGILGIKDDPETWPTTDNAGDGDATF